jgi:phosphoribosylaminoimidazolecarboxamide formyltransferase / IMP cyclohydrolase
MNRLKSIKSALISVYYKEGLAELVQELHKNKVLIYSTGGTQTFIESLKIPVIAVETLTNFPEILGGRVKTLHPTIFGGILNRRNLESDKEAIQKHGIPEIDLVIVDLYPFEETVAAGGSHEENIEKIDIGGISLIRAAAKNYKDVVIIPSVKCYSDLKELLISQSGATTYEQRKKFAAEAFHISSHYDTLIQRYFTSEDQAYFKESISKYEVLRYGENPHQKGKFYGDLNAVFDKLHGKELSYNNLLDVDAAVALLEEFKNEEPTFAILKHNNACGIATRPSIEEAYVLALAADPVSAFGGILISNAKIDLKTAVLINELFCEVLIAPGYDLEGLELLKSKKNRIILVQKEVKLPKHQFRTILNGVLVQDRDEKSENREDLKVKTTNAPSENEIDDLLFANKLVKHTKSNTIVLVKNRQLLASGTGQTSRVDALNQAIHKAKTFQFELMGAVMASDAFFPFPDCVEIAHNEGIDAVIQPGGSLKDQLSIDYCNKEKMRMVFTGIRHFKH